ncbi:MAG: RDD family protein [Planctomycetes bacterium]|nr:RDD family protein [Planctomycetota bacterium]
MDSLHHLDTTIEIVTPENIAFHYRVAGPFRRLPAFLLDLAVRIGVFMAVLFSIGLIAGFGGGGVAVAGILIGWFLLEWFYGGFFESYWNGQTPGKWVMGIRVLTTDGQPINGLQAVMRNVLRAADMYPLLSAQIFGDAPPVYMIPTFFVGLVTMACNQRFQRLGDLVCGTLVVIEEKHWLTGVVKIDDPRAAQLAEYLPADFQVSRTLARTLSSYVERRRFFTTLRRREIAMYLGEPLLQKLGLPKDTSYDLLLCALYYRTFIADRADEAMQRETSAAIGQNPFRGGPQLPDTARSLA